MRSEGLQEDPCTIVRRACGVVVGPRSRSRDNGGAVLIAESLDAYGQNRDGLGSLPVARAPERMRPRRGMRGATAVGTLVLVVSACGPTAPVLPAAPITEVATSTSLPATFPASPPPEPLGTATTSPTLETPGPTVGTDTTVKPFADLPGNIAAGEPAADFGARVLGGGSFLLSEQRGSPVLIFPTAVGCGDCVSFLAELSAAYPGFRGQGLTVLILNLYPEDVPETWEPFAAFFAQPEFIWAVVNSTGFVVDYNISGLGTTFLVDPGGLVVFRSEYPLVADELRALLELATP